MLTGIASVQSLLITGLLLVAGTVKIITAGREDRAGMLTRLGPAVLAPPGWKRPAMIACGAGEITLGGGFIMTGLPLFRWGTAAFFLISSYVLWELRRNHPGIGCGCFGEASATPTGWRAITRAALLMLAALSTLIAPLPAWMIVPSLSLQELAILGVTVLIFMAVSPEVDELIERLRHRAPCELRPVARERSLARLRSSGPWREHRHVLAAETPLDAWREGCWHFFVFAAGEREVVFAVYLSGIRPIVRSAMVDAAALGKSNPVSLQL